jgi:hypothetical protein
LLLSGLPGDFCSTLFANKAVSEPRYLLSYRSSPSQIGAIFKNLFNASQFLDLDYQQPWEQLLELQVHYRD